MTCQSIKEPNGNSVVFAIRGKASRCGILVCHSRTISTTSTRSSPYTDKSESGSQPHTEELRQPVQSLPVPVKTYPRQNRHPCVRYGFGPKSWPKVEECDVLTC